MFKVFRWRDGHYNFNATDSVDFDRENFSPMSADFILMEGIRMVDEWPIIEKKIPSFDIVFRTVVDPSMIEVGGGGGGRGQARRRQLLEQDPPLRRGRAHLPEGRRRCGRCRPSSTPRASREFDVCRILYDLLNRNIVAPAGKGATRKVVEEEEPTAGSPPRLPGT